MCIRAKGFGHIAHIRFAQHRSTPKEVELQIIKRETPADFVTIEAVCGPYEVIELNQDGNGRRYLIVIPVEDPMNQGFTQREIFNMVKGAFPFDGANAEIAPGCIPEPNDVTYAGAEEARSSVAL